MRDNTILTLISILADGEFHSGEQLGDRLGMSRAAINSIFRLSATGVDVFTVPGKGYSLPEPIQLLDEKRIAAQIEHGRVTVLPLLTRPTSICWIVLMSCNPAMPALQNISRPAAVVEGAKWFLPLAQTSISRCTGGWRVPLPQWD